MSNDLGTREQSVIIALHYALITPGFHHFYNYQSSFYQMRNALIHFFTMDTSTYACYIGNHIDDFSDSQNIKSLTNFLVKISAMNRNTREFITHASFIWIEYEEKLEQQPWYQEFVSLLQGIMRERPISVLCVS